ncbi:ABC transporter permease [Halosolutus amylolyticus]|uniref:ABC transporter permease n=1 Tax=Halosolutus amylolyticus TaxID=2932267 RepID=A0ABD5PSJ9_9EURY|nr:ABC transporter permease [Halosolutus amylolyticus]
MSISGLVVRTCAVAGIGFAQLRRAPGRTALTVLAVTLAVLSVTLLAGLGIGVVETGEDGLDSADRDIWIASEPVDPAASGTENPIADAHGVTREVSARDDVQSATPIAMHAIYVGTEPSDLERRSAVGIHETHDGFDFQAGGGFNLDREDVVAEEGAPPDEPPTGEIVIDPRIAEAHDVGVGDTIYVGASREGEGAKEFTVVGISGHHSQYLGTPSVTIPLVDLQVVTGTAGTDRATFVTADVAEDADRDAVRDDLAAAYPAYDVRTSDEQIEAMIEERPIVLASGFTLVGLAVVGGVVLTANLFVLVTAQQREQLAALRAIGLSRPLLAGTIGVQGLFVGVLGGLVGIAATPPIAAGLNRLAASVVGFDRLLRTSHEVYAVGFLLAVGVGTLVALVTGWRAGRYARVEHLEE